MTVTVLQYSMQIEDQNPHTMDNNLGASGDRLQIAVERLQAAAHKMQAEAHGLQAAAQGLNAIGYNEKPGNTLIPENRLIPYKISGAD